MLSTGAVGTPVSCVDATAGGSISWTRLTGIPDGPNGTTSFTNSAFGSGAFTHQLQATQYGFSVPGGATITGVVLEVRSQRDTSAATIQDKLVSLIKGGTVSGDNKATTTVYGLNAVNNGDAVAWQTYGSPTTLWGLSLTPSDVNASTFGAAVSCQNPSATTGSAGIDAMRITVYYTTAGTQDSNSHLRWRPPAQSSPTVTVLGTGSTSNSYGASEDVILTMPASAKTSLTSTDGGRHIRMVGGSHNRATGAAQSELISIVNATGSVFLEGLDLDAGSFVATENDCILAGGSADGAKRPDVYIQNCRLMGVAGSLSGGHGDGFGPWVAINNLYIDRVTVQTGYQGFFLDPLLITGSVYISRTNIVATSPPGDGGFVYWFTRQSDPQAYHPIYLDQVYAKALNGADFMTGLVWPPQGQTNGATTSDGGNSMTFPAVTQITGSIIKGDPPGGDFCPPGSVGLSYGTPGYIPSQKTRGGAGLSEPDVESIP